MPSSMAEELSFRRLKASDAAAVARAVSAASPGYMRFYKTFSFDAASLRAAFSKAKKDRYWGIFSGKDLAGYFMLRGFDEGFAIPSYGVLIAEPFAGRGLSRLALQYAVCWCRLKGVKTMMLKCHPDNHRAVKVYESMGFKAQGPDPKNGDVIFHKGLSS